MPEPIAPPPGFTKFSPAGFTPVGKPAEKPDTRSVLGGAMADVFGISGRPGAVPLTGVPGYKTPVGVLTKPETAVEKAAQLAVEIPMVTIAGAVVPAMALPAWLGRIAMSGALGAGKAAATGEDVGFGTALDIAAAAVPELGGAAGGKLLAKLGESAAAYRWATEAPKKALDALKARFPGAKVIIPSIDQKKKIGLEEAVEGLSGKTDEAYQVTRAEIMDWMNRLDRQRRLGRPVTRAAGSLFGELTAPKRFTPGALPRASQVGADVLRANVPRAVADVAATQPLGESGIPVGVGLGAVAAEALDPRRLAERVLPVRTP